MEKLNLKASLNNQDNKEVSRIEPVRLEELDALRGIAAMLVVFFHYTMAMPSKSIFWELGVTGVDLFFIISGFVIYMSIKNETSARRFLLKRFFRLFPTYWIIVTFTSLLYFIPGHLIEVPMSLERYLYNLTMFQSYFDVPDIDGPYWTMIIELLFYFIIALLLFLKKMAYIMPVGYFLLSLILINELIIQPIDRELFTLLFDLADKWCSILIYFPWFFSGVIFYKIYTNGPSWKLNAGVIICFLTIILIFQNTGKSNGYIFFPQYLFMISLYFGAFILLVKNKLSIIVNPITLYLGKISFPLYLIHQYIGIYIISAYLCKTLHVDRVQALIISVVISILLASLVMKYIEQPCIRFYRNKWGHKK